MHNKLLRNLDLNLLLPFDSLYRIGSVKQAAEQLNLSQSAFSHALNRLRKALDDELFVRVNSRMQPTRKAEQLAPLISQALTLLQQGLQQADTFSAKCSEHEFVIAATDYCQISLLPRLMQLLVTEAPKIRVRVIHLGEDAFDQLAAQEVDYLLGFTHSGKESNDILAYRWVSGSYCLLASAAHPVLKQPLTLERYLELQHLRIAPLNEHTSIVDQCLEKLGHQRQQSLTTPNLLVAPYIIAETELVASYPQPLAEQICQQLPLKILPLPFEVPDYQLQFYCHRLNAGEPEFKWFTQLLLKVADGLNTKTPSI